MDNDFIESIQIQITGTIKKYIEQKTPELLSELSSILQSPVMVCEIFNENFYKYNGYMIFRSEEVHMVFMETIFYNENFSAKILESAGSHYLNSPDKPSPSEYFNYINNHFSDSLMAKNFVIDSFIKIFSNSIFEIKERILGMGIFDFNRVTNLPLLISSLDAEELINLMISQSISPENYVNYKNKQVKIKTFIFYNFFDNGGYQVIKDMLSFKEDKMEYFKFIMEIDGYSDKMFKYLDQPDIMKDYVQHFVSHLTNTHNFITNTKYHFMIKYCNQFDLGKVILTLNYPFLKQLPNFKDHVGYYPEILNSLDIQIIKKWFSRISPTFVIEESEVQNIVNYINLIYFKLLNHTTDPNFKDTYNTNLARLLSCYQKQSYDYVSEEFILEFTKNINTFSAHNNSVGALIFTKIYRSNLSFDEKLAHLCNFKFNNIPLFHSYARYKWNDYVSLEDFIDQGFITNETLNILTVYNDNFLNWAATCQDGSNIKKLLELPYIEEKHLKYTNSNGADLFEICKHSGHAHILLECKAFTVNTISLNQIVKVVRGINQSLIKKFITKGILKRIWDCTVTELKDNGLIPKNDTFKYAKFDFELTDEECDICCENKKIVKNSCGHKICIPCSFKMHKCPYCRKSFSNKKIVGKNTTIEFEDLEKHIKNLDDIGNVFKRDFFDKLFQDIFGEDWEDAITNHGFI